MGKEKSGGGIKSCELIEFSWVVGLREGKREFERSCGCKSKVLEDLEVAVKLFLALV